MNPFQPYLLDEFAEDYRSGRMSRRAFVVKGIGVAGGLAAASAVLRGQPPLEPRVFQRQR